MSEAAPAAKRGVYTTERRRLIAYLKRGGAVTREDFGGAVGVAWLAATRSGNAFITRVADKLLAGGCKIDGVRRELRHEPEHPNTFKLHGVEL